jgi:hypothetical protein
VNTHYLGAFLGKIIITVISDVAGIYVYWTCSNDFKRPERNPGPGVCMRRCMTNKNVVIGVFEIYGSCGRGDVEEEKLVILVSTMTG